MSEKVTLTANGTPIHFDVTNETHERLIDEIQKDSKVVPMHNFLSRSVVAESKEILKPLLKNPGNVMQLGGQLLDKITPHLEITVGE